MLFLSHSGSDALTALALASGLRAAGLDVWCAHEPKSMKVGVPVRQQLERKLKESTGLILLVGRRGVSRWVDVEVDIAHNRYIEDASYRIVPLLLPEARVQHLPAVIARLHAHSLAGDVTKWGPGEFQALAEHIEASTSQLAVEPGACPFPGLESFGVKDTRYYFGRDREIREALALLGRFEPDKGVYRRWLAVEGTSGVGKSSFVKAGLVPAIRNGRVRGAPRRWRIARMRPGKDPVRQLALALVRAFRWKDKSGQLARVQTELLRDMGLHDLVGQELKKGWGFLLIIDQLEEVFTLSEESPNLHQHLDSLLHKALEGGGPFHLITTIRSDFLGHMGELPHLTKVLNTQWNSRYVLLPMGAEELREALLAPAQLAQLSWEPGLPERILKEAQAVGEELPLPLVAHVLRELWMQKSPLRELTRKTYDELGGVGGALTHSADTLLATFSTEERALVRKLMLALVKVGRGTRDVRRTLTRDEAVRCGGGGKQGESILARLSGSRRVQGAAAPPRLLSVSTERVDLVHEALLEQWQTLQGWLDESREELERQVDLEAAAQIWKTTGALPSEAQLQYLRSAKPVDDLSRKFLEATRRLAIARGLVARAQTEPASHEPQLTLRLILEAYQIAPDAQQTKALVAWFQQKQRLLLKGHASTVTAAAFSPDGRRILTASADSTACLWDTGSGRLLGRMRGHTQAIRTACFSPDGLHVLTGSADSTACLWDSNSGQRLATLDGHSQAVRTVCFSPDGLRILTASDDGRARIWLTQSHKLLAELRGHSDSVITACFSPDGHRVLTGSDDSTARLWEPGSGKTQFVLSGHSGPVTAACFSPDGRRVLTASADRTARLWEAGSGKLEFELQGHNDSVTAARFNPDGRRILTGSADGTARLWSLNSYKPELERKLRAHSHPVRAVSFSADGHYILTASADCTARLWDTDHGFILAELLGHSHTVRAASFSPDGLRVLTAGDDHTARLWDTISGRPLTELHGHGYGVLLASFSPDGGRILTVSYDQTARLWDVASGQVLAELTSRSQGGRSQAVRAACFSPDSRHVLTANDDHITRLWSASSGGLLTELSGHSCPVTAACFSPDARRVLTASDDHTAHLWDADSGAPQLKLQGHSGPVTPACFSPDGRRVLTASDDHTARLWDAGSGGLLAELRGHSAPVTAACFNADGRRVLTASDDRTACLWDADSGSLLAELHKPHTSLTVFGFSPDGRRVLTGSTDGTVRLWGADSGEARNELRAHSQAVTAASFSPDGRRFFTGSEDQTGRLWDTDSGSLVTELLKHSGTVTAAQFSPDGRCIVTAGEKHLSRLWDTDSGNPLAEFYKHPYSVTLVRFSPDGLRVLTAGKHNTAQLWSVHELCAPIEALIKAARNIAREFTDEERRFYLNEER